MNANREKAVDATTAFSRSEKRALGKALHEKCPRSSQKEWKLRAKSQDPIKLLEESDKDRIPGLIAEKYQRMAVSPFTFFRGAAIIQARDLANARVSGITVHACGDCHLMNFGGFASPVEPRLGPERQDNGVESLHLAAPSAAPRGPVSRMPVEPFDNTTGEGTPRGLRRCSPCITAICVRPSKNASQSSAGPTVAIGVE